MKILYSYLDLQKEGSAIHVSSFIKAARALGHIVVDNPFSPGNGFPPTRHKNKLIRFIQRGYSWGKRSFKFFMQTFILVYKENPDVLLLRHLSNHHFFISIVFFSFFKPITLEINSIGSFEKRQTSLVNDLLDKATVFLSKKCCVVSDVVKDFLVENLNTHPSKVHVVPNGVDIQQFDPQLSGAEIRGRFGLSDKFIVGFVGTFKPWHGIDNIIAMAVKLRQQNPGMVFLVVGGGNGQKKVEAAIKENNLSNIMLRGYVPHNRIPFYLAAMDIVISPHVFKTGSFHGSPLKLFEYMAMAKPIIAAPIGQINDLIENGVSGKLIPSDDINAWVLEIEKMYKNPRYRDELGVNARIRVAENYTWTKNAEFVVAMCRQAIG